MKRHKNVTKSRIAEDINNILASKTLVRMSIKFYYLLSHDLIRASVIFAL